MSKVKNPIQMHGKPPRLQSASRFYRTRWALGTCRRLCAGIGQAVRDIISRFRSPDEPNHKTNDSGPWGEDMAADYLQKTGYRILGQRIRTAQREEIDLIAATSDTLVFVEVKTRADETYGRPYDAVNRTKRLQLTRAGARYIKRLRRPPPYVRFDVVEVIGEPGDPSPEVRHLENAFAPEAGYRI